MSTGDAQDDSPSPIARLPPEILADIFVRCVPVSIGRLQTDHSWLNIPKVCVLWRNVALTCPELWSTLPLGSLHTVIPVFLKRSKMAPLVIRADVRKVDRTFGMVYFQGLIKDNAERLGILELRSAQRHLTDFLSCLGSAGPAPRLQCLKIVNTTANNNGEGGMWLPHDFLLWSAVVDTRIQTRTELRLHLECCAFPWHSAWYSHVTHLHLENISALQRPMMEMLLTILLGSPTLQTFALIHCSPTTFDGFPVDLPHLSALTVRGNSAATCAHLLRYLIIPPSATINISCNIKTLQDSDTLIVSLLSDFSRASPAPYDTVRIIHKDGFAYSLFDSVRPWWFRRFRIEGKSCQPYDALCDATRVLVDTLDFAGITTLHLHGMQGALPPAQPQPDWRRPITARMWVALGRRLNSVRTLHLHKTVPAEWLDFLLTQAMFVLGVTHWNYGPYELAVRAPDGISLTHAWAGLQRLCLHSLDLGEISPSPLEPLPVTRADLLRALLWARREGGGEDLATRD
ncbi:hypothetical protein MVEN_02206300 [Mycena venus]|uniref:F-box domain-containing protein n=1 Tax=Mycena venus TaxID=2733690 RepID=A0A8H6X7L4_9AGAR|nr:hypothetical protein MVEN_02206300 [Mycena venus]